MSLPAPDSNALLPLPSAQAAQMQTQSASLPCNAVAQCQLQQFMVSVWLHFFRQQGSDAAMPWKECGRRRRQDFFNARLPDTHHFARYVISHSPAGQRAQLAAVLHSRLASCITGEACKSSQTDPSPCPQ